MKSNFIKYIFLLNLFYCLSPTLLLADTNKDVTISGKAAEAIKVTLIKYPHHFIVDDKYREDYSSEANSGEFSFRLYRINEPTYISIIFWFGKNKFKTFDFYLVEPGDSIYINFEKDSASFSGKSSKKFLCQYQAAAIKVLKRLEVVNGKIDDYLNTKNEQNDSLCNKKITILKKYRSILSNNTFAILYSDYSNEKLLMAFSEIEKCLRIFSNDSIRKKQVIAYYLDHYRHQKADTTNIQVLIYSKNYIAALLNKIFLDCKTENNGNKLFLDSLTAIAIEVYRQVNANYSGILKQKLLTVLFARQIIIDDSLGIYINKAVKQVSEPYFKNILAEIQRKTKGAPAFDFSLVDSAGKKISSNEFKGKVVVMDFWYTGCPACPFLAETIKPIAKKKDSGTVFITVSIDKDKEKWKESLRNRKYSSDDEINLYTGGLGTDHPLTSYYQINTFPFLLVIDTAGKIFSVNPVLGSDQNIRIARLEKIIENARK